MVSDELENQLLASPAARRAVEQGARPGEAALYEDLTRINNELVNVQRQLVQKNFELEKLAAENARLYAEAQELLRMRNGFLSILTHDLKTPLGTIIGYTQLLARRFERDAVQQPAKILANLRFIEAAAKKMTGQVNEVLEIARLQQGEVPSLEREPVDLVSLVQQVSSDLQPLSMQPTITVNAAVSSLVGQWDVRQLERMLSNLLSNAIKYSPAGGRITVEVATQEATATEPAYAVVRVRDQGVGIPAQDLPYIFEPFRRAGNMADRIDGTGIGLTSVRNGVAMHGGTIAVESEEGVGTTFTVRLPLNPPLPA